jgi:microcystin-dependent protein
MASRIAPAPAALMLGLGLLVAAPEAQALDQSDYTGRVGLVAGAYCPRGTVEADGRILQVRDNSALYSLLGNKFGGDGTNTFALPDLRQKVPVSGMLYCIVLSGVYPSR